MPGKKKKFIDKKNAVSFHLVHRSQKDPLQADEDAPQRVLLPVGGGSEPEKTARKEEERKYGVFYDDDYDYLQHLRDVDELYNVEPTESFRLVSSEPAAPSVQVGINPHDRSGITLPSSVFASETETDVGLLNKAAPISGPRLDMDPDIVAAMDEDFDFTNPDNQLDDDFIVQANAPGEGFDAEFKGDFEPDDRHRLEDEDDAETFRPYSYRPEVEVLDDEDDDDGSDVSLTGAGGSEDEGSEVGGLEDRSFGDMDTKSRFTNYSMTSSVIQRSAGLTLLDDRFEKVYEQYDDGEIGALDHEDIDGYLKQDSQLLNVAMEEFEKQQQQTKLKDAIVSGREMVGPGDCPSDDDSSSDDDKDLVKMTIEQPKKWDCESILSTHSTLYNHPRLISEPKKPIKLTKRAQLPAETLPERGFSLKQLEKEQTQVHAGDRANTYRSRAETTEERKQRKNAIKEERRLRREEKKSNKIVFKQEKIRQVKESLNAQQTSVGTSIT